MIPIFFQKKVKIHMPYTIEKDIFCEKVKHFFFNNYHTLVILFFKYIQIMKIKQLNSKKKKSLCSATEQQMYVKYLLYFLQNYTIICNSKQLKNIPLSYSLYCLNNL